MSGTLWVVATPIGNLEDISDRARRVLEQVDVIAAEDTRVVRRLLSALGITNRVVSLHEHNEAKATPRLLERLRSGEQIALVSDAGTPLISDPGFYLVRAARREGIRVSPIPGASAAIAALSVSGLPADRFWFEGFLPPRAGARKKRIAELAGTPATLIFFEAARRLPKTLADLAAVLGGGRAAVLARELTKQFETVLDGSLESLRQAVEQDPQQQLGEAVVVVAGVQESDEPYALDVQSLARELSTELPPARAARVLTRVAGFSRKQAFALIEGLKDKPR